MQRIGDIAESPNLRNRIKSAVRDVLSKDFNISRTPKQFDLDSEPLLGAYSLNDDSDFPVHEPTGEKTRKTYDFTRKLKLPTNLL